LNDEENTEKIRDAEAPDVVCRERLVLQLDGGDGS
jgi:hypothetical protein